MCTFILGFWLKFCSVWFSLGLSFLNRFELGLGWLKPNRFGPSRFRLNCLGLTGLGTGSVQVWKLPNQLIQN